MTGFRLRAAGVALASGLAFSCAGPSGPTADLVLHNGRVVTMDDDRPEVTALAAEGGVIQALGSDGCGGRSRAVGCRYILVSRRTTQHNARRSLTEARPKFQIRSFQ